MLRCRFYLCLLPLFAQVTWANDGAWNCQQDKNSKDWVCVGQKQPITTKPAITQEGPITHKPLEQVTEQRQSLGAMATPKPVKSIEAVDMQPIRQAPVAEGKMVPVDKAKPAVSAVTATPPVASTVMPVPPTVINPVSPDVQASELAKIKQEAAATAASIAPAGSYASQIDAERLEHMKSVEAMTAATKPSQPSNQAKLVDNTAKISKSEQPGWHCGSGSGQEGWDCKLVGADPKGKAKTVDAAGDSYSLRLLDPVFDRREENIFTALQERFPVDPWQNCGIEIKAPKQKQEGSGERETSPLDLNSNYSEMYDNQIGNYMGDVEIRRADQRASSHSAHYDTVSDILNLHGNVFYSEDEMAVYTDTATLKLATDEARLRDTLFIAPSTPIRGRAKAVYRDNPYLSRYRDATYTSCKPGNQDWAVHASELKINKETGKGAAKNTWVEFKGFPVFYSPYLSFPIDERRMTGFLAPSIGNTRASGFDFAAPFYWNLAPNYDATLRPRFLSERGVLLGGDFRYLTPSSNGMFSAEIMPHDGKKSGTVQKSGEKAGENPNYGRSRYQLSFNNFTRFTPKFTSNMDLNYVSDKNYFSELGNALSFSNFRYIKSFADLKYIDNGWSVTGQVVNYQRVDPTTAVPYRKLPQINLAFDHVFKDLPQPLVTELDSEFVYFQRDSFTTMRVDKDGNPVSATNQPVKDGNFVYNTTEYPQAQRFNIKPSISMPWKNDYAYVTPKFSLQYTQYFLQNQNGIKGNNPDSVSRVSPILSVDSGLFLERDVDLLGGKYQHTLEPRLFYLYIPQDDQRDIPLFDTGLYDFRYNTMFRENRFSGIDRVQDANQVTLGFTSRLIDSTTGQEKLKLNIGNIIYFKDRETTLNYFDRNGVERSVQPFKTAFREQAVSNIVAELSGQLNEHFSLDSGIQWNPNNNHIERGDIGLHFVNEPGQLINLGFQFRRDWGRCRSIDGARDEFIEAANGDYIKDANGNYVRQANGNYTKVNIPAVPGCESVRAPTPEDLADPSSPNNPNNSFDKNDIVLTDASFRWPIYDDWYGIGRWQYSWLYGRTQEAFFGLEKENCCWRFRIIGRRYFNGLINTGTNVTSFDLNTAQAQTGVFFQIELKGLTGLGEKLDNFFERNIYGYQKPVD